MTFTHAAPAGSLEKKPAAPGKWLLFVSSQHAAHCWALVAQATKDGRLGFDSKVSDLGQSGSRVIVVYTADWHDQDDVRRVLREVRRLGWAGTLSYKRDEETFAGTYGQGSAYYVSPCDDELEIQLGGPKLEAHDPQRRSEGQCAGCFLLVPARTLSQAGRCQDCA
jgi:hypothetical protein